jgi:hypothetical protein
MSIDFWDINDFSMTDNEDGTADLTLITPEEVLTLKGLPLDVAKEFEYYLNLA